MVMHTDGSSVSSLDSDTGRSVSYSSDKFPTQVCCHQMKNVYKIITLVRALTKKSMIFLLWHMVREKKCFDL